jgi:hypothetical protein
MRRLKGKLTYANIVATLALFIAVGGASAFAATQLGKNSVGTKQIKKGAVTGAKIKKGTITETNINLAKLGTVPSATSATTATTADGLSAPESKHMVGQSGQPGFEGGSTNYSPPGITYPPASFYRDHDGIVHLEGVVKVGKEASLDPIFTLPAGFRPGTGTLQIFPSAGAGAGVLVTGTNTSIEGHSYNGILLGEEEEILVLNGITFRAEG